MKNKSIQGGKHCEKRRNCLLQAISPFLTIFSTAIYLSCVKMQQCVVMGKMVLKLVTYENIDKSPIYMYIKCKVYRNSRDSVFIYDKKQQPVSLSQAAQQ